MASIPPPATPTPLKTGTRAKEVRRPAPSSDGPGAVSEDGRHLRSADSRARIVTAMVELVQEGDPSPGAEAVAARAGVGLRTVFRQFSDMEGLYAEMVAATRGEFITCFGTKLEAPDWQGRILELSDRLVTIYDQRMHLRRAGNARRHQSASLDSGIRALNSTIKGVVQREMPSTLYFDTIRMERLLMMLSFDVWLRLRDEQELDSATSKLIVRVSLEELLAEPTAR